MDSQNHLPKFRNPPVSEVVHGVQFAPLSMTVAHPGLFFTRIRQRFPICRTVPALPPMLLPGGPPQIQGIQFADPSEVPRAWFIDSAETMLLQLQADRFLLNWRREPSKAKYPHFERVQADFQELYRTFEKFASEEGLGAITPTFGEMSYINQIPLVHPDGSPRLPQDVLRSWQEDFGPDWTDKADAVNWQALYRLRREDGSSVGRLTATLANVVSPLGRALQLDLSVHGVPQPSTFKGMVELHQMAHETIVKYFKAVTTDAAHTEWELIT